jgi:UDP-N-acetylglucosamine--N-acetylmuramyl-(pentapeptide) pyrophosphoryl-undecaprenol N-acetylglucosamine transferase
MLKIVLTGGGTAGHCQPNINLLPHLYKNFDKIFYIGSNGIEKKLKEDDLWQGKFYST